MTVAVWVQHRFYRQYNVETGWPAGPFLWLKGCKFSPNKSQNPPFFCLWALRWTETNHPCKSANHSGVTLFLWKQFYLIAVTRFVLSHQPLLRLLFPFYKHIHMWELTSRDVCLNLNSLGAPAGSARSRNCSSRAAGPRCWRAGTHWTGGRAPNWPEWLQSEPIRDKRSIALQIGSDSIVLCDRATIALLTKQRTGVQALSRSGGLSSNPERAPPWRASHTLSKHTERLDCSTLYAFILWGENPSRCDRLVPVL